MLSNTVMLLTLIFIIGVGAQNFSNDDAIDFLERYGYMNSSDTSLQDLTTYLVKFQEKYNLPVDGTLNDETIKLMQRPRCSHKDVNDAYMLHSNWNKTDLKWYFPLATQAQIDVAQKAFDLWAKDSKFTFTNVMIIREKPDITITFGPNRHYFRRDCMGNGPCGTKFDGRGRILAHAFFPNNDLCREIHLDSNEIWNLNLNATNIPDGESSLYLVLVHELGHSLGLEHSSIKTAIMYPWYQSEVTSLDEDDKMGLEALYGPIQEHRYVLINRNTTTPRTTPHTQRSPTPTTQRTTQPTQGLCNILPDFMFLATSMSFPNYRLYIGSGQKLWKIDLNDMKIPQQFDPIHLYLPKELKTYPITHIFQNGNGDLVAYANQKCYTASFPQLNIQDELTLPIPSRPINALFQTNSGKTFVFYDNTSYIEFANNPYQISNRGLISDQFPGIPPGITSAFRFTDGYIYFFHNQTYYKFSEYTRKVVAAGPFNWNLFGIPCPTDSLKEQLKTLLSKIISFYE